MIERKYDFFRNNQLKCVYVIHNMEFNRVKIGITDNPKARLCTLIGASGCNLELKYTTPFMRMASQVEKLAHNHFKHKRLLGEWFDVSVQEVVMFLQSHLVDYIHEDEFRFYVFIEEEKKKKTEHKMKKRIGWKKLDAIRDDLYYKKEYGDGTNQIIFKGNPFILEKILDNEKPKEFKNNIEKGKVVIKDYPIGEEIVLDRPLTKFKRLDKNIFKDKEGIVYKIRYINKQWIMKRIK